MIQNALETLTGMNPAIAMLVKMSLVLAAGWSLHFALAKSNPRWRVLAWRGVAAGMFLALASLILPSIEWPVKVGSEQGIEVARTVYRAPSANHARPAVAVSAPSAQNQHPHFAELYAAAKARPGAIALVVWAIVAVILMNRYRIGVRNVKRLLKKSRAAERDLSDVFCAVAERLGVAGRAGLRVSSAIGSPMVCGLRRPIIVIPERMTQRDYAAELPAIFTHELAHVGGHDIFWMNFIEIMGIAMWFHPLAWRMHNAHAAACETICDSLAANEIGDPAVYSRTLARIALELIDRQPAYGIPMAMPQIRKRLAAIGTGINAAPLKRGLVRTIALCALALLMPFVLLRPVQAEPKSAPSNPTPKPHHDKLITEKDIVTRKEIRYVDSGDGKVFFLTYAAADEMADTIYAALGVPEQQIRLKGFWLARGDKRAFHDVSIRMKTIRGENVEVEIAKGETSVSATLKNDEETDLLGYRFKVASMRSCEKKERAFVIVRDLAAPQQTGPHDGLEITPVVDLNALAVITPRPEEYETIKNLIVENDHVKKLFLVEMMLIDAGSAEKNKSGIFSLFNRSSSAKAIDLPGELGLPKNQIELEDTQGNIVKSDRVTQQLTPEQLAKLKQLFPEHTNGDPTHSGRVYAAPKLSVIDGNDSEFIIQQTTDRKSDAYAFKVFFNITMDKNGNFVVQKMVISEDKGKDRKQSELNMTLPRDRSLLVNLPLNSDKYMVVTVKWINEQDYREQTNPQLIQAQEKSKSDRMQKLESHP
ncbi:M56 family metallopeptidase [bacterium]|nr:M56 family metallopeptidase [bacterium]